MSKSWAVPTWIFLHTLAAQLPEERYASIKVQLLEQVKSLLAVLPCPDCAKHATEAMEPIKLSHVSTKTAFKQVLWKFHNSVNGRLGKRQLPEAELAVYDRCNLRVVYAIFFQEFMKPSHNSKLMMDVMMRNRVMAKFHHFMMSIL
jgi:hypothetical protein